jgi:hypothetical protein
MIARAKQTALGLAVVLLGLVIPTATGFSDIGDRVSITLKSGATYTGTIVAESASEISVLTEPDKIKVTIPKDLIAEIKILEPKRKEEPKAREITPRPTQSMISLMASGFNVASDQGAVWGWAAYGRAGILPGPLVGFGLSSAAKTEYEVYQGVQISGSINHYLMFLTGGAMLKESWGLFGLLGLYGASIDLYGSAEIEPECSWYWNGWNWEWVCRRVWLEVSVYARLEGTALGFIAEHSIAQSIVSTVGWWVEVSPTLEGSGKVRTCKEGSGCSESYFSLANVGAKPAGILTGYMIGIGLRW